MARRRIVSGSAKAARRKKRKKSSAIQARRKQEFRFQGKTVEELLELTHEDILQLLSSRARRSYNRGLNPEEEVFIKRLLKDDKPVLKTHRRNIVILPSFVGKTVAVYNGKEYREVEIKAEMIGHYLGEFSLTRAFSKHSGPGVGATKSSKFMPLK